MLTDNSRLTLYAGYKIISKEVTWGQNSSIVIKGGGYFEFEHNGIYYHVQPQHPELWSVKFTDESIMLTDEDASADYISGCIVL